MGRKNNWDIRLGWGTSLFRSCTVSVIRLTFAFRTRTSFISVLSKNVNSPLWSYRRSGKKLLKYQFNSFCVITSLILLTTLIRHRNYKEKFDADHSNGLYRRKDGHFLHVHCVAFALLYSTNREHKEFKSFRIVCSIYGQPSSYLYRMIYIAYVTAAEDIGSSSKAVSC